MVSKELDMVDDPEQPTSQNSKEKENGKNSRVYLGF